MKIWGSYCKKQKKRNSKIHPLIIIYQHPRGGEEDDGRLRQVFSSVEMILFYHQLMYNLFLGAEGVDSPKSLRISCRCVKCKKDDNEDMIKLTISLFDQALLYPNH